MKEIGTLLKEARESKGIEIKDVAKALKIRPYYIEVMESGDFSAVSSEIYIAGYLKSYAVWLGVGSHEIIRKLKTDGNKFTLPVLSVDKGKKEPSSYFGFDDDLVSAGGVITLVSLVLAVIIYTFLCKVSNVNVSPAFDFVTRGEATSGGRNWADGLVRRGGKFLLVAQDAVILKVKENGGGFVNKQLEVGEIYFLSVSDGVIIETDNPGAVDVMIDDGNGASLGSLADIAVSDAAIENDENKEKTE